MVYTNRMVDTNPITGDRIISKMRDKKKYDDNYDRVFKKDDEKVKTFKEKGKMEEDILQRTEDLILKRKEGNEK